MINLMRIKVLQKKVHGGKPFINYKDLSDQYNIADVYECAITHCKIIQASVSARTSNRLEPVTATIKHKI